MVLMSTPGTLIHRVCDDALDDGGYVLKVSAATAGNVEKCDTALDVPFGVNYISTEDLTKPGTYLTLQRTAIIRDGVARCKLTPQANRTAAINVGDFVCAHTDGKIKNHTIRTDTIVNNNTDRNAIVGIALEYVAATSDLPSLGSQPGISETIVVALSLRGA